MPSIPQPSLSGGELSPSLYGRVDLAIYQTSLKTCENFITQAYGGIKNRQGTRFVSAAYSDSRRSRLVPFSFNAEQNYVIEICGKPDAATASVARVFSRGRLQYSGSNPITIPIPWLTTQLRDLKFSQSGDVLTVTHPEHRPQQIVRKSETDWSIRDLPFKAGPFQSMNSEKGWTVSSSGTGPGGTDVTITCNYPIFTQGTIGQLFKIEQKNFGTPWEPGKDVTLGSIRRSDGKYYRATSTGRTGSLRPTHDSDSWTDGGAGGPTDGVTGVTWEYLHPGWGWGTIIDTPTDNTAILRVGENSRIPDGCVLTAGAGAGEYVLISGVATSPVFGGASGEYSRIRATTAAHHLEGNPGPIKVNITLVFSTAGETARTLNFTGTDAYPINATEIDFDMSADWITELVVLDGALSRFSIAQTDAADVPTATHKWAFGAWGGNQGWPAASAYFQQRHCFAGSLGQPQTVWTSRTGDYENFSTSSPIQDDDALIFTVASAAIDGIKSLLPLDKLVMFTLGGNWVTASGQSDVLTPGNISAKLQNYYGSSNKPPLGVGNTALYYGRGGTIRDMSYDFGSDSYVGNDLTVKASHLLQDHSLYEWDFQTSPFPIVWMVRDDGILLGMTYLREEKVVGWHPHDLGGTVESVCVINECNEDHVYLTITRTINGSTKRFIEVMYPRTDDLYEGYFVDSGFTYDGRNTDSTYTMTATGTYTVGGSVTIVASTAVFQAGDVSNHVVMEAADGSIQRFNIASVASSTQVTATVLTTAVPSDLQATATSAWGLAKDSFSGLTHLEGQGISVLADGVYSVATVSGGAFTLSTPGFVVSMGLPITSTMETLSVTVPGQQGPLRENHKLISSVRLLVENSRSTYVGPDTSNLLKATIRTAEDEQTEVTRYTGVLEAKTAAGWNRNGRFIVRHTEPTPLSILALFPNVSMGGA